MSKLPFMKFYPGDWLVSTAALSLENKGRYFDLICYLWANTDDGQMIFLLDDLAKLFSCTVTEALRSVTSLRLNGCIEAKEVGLDNDLKGIKITQRRIQRDKNEYKNNAERQERHRQKSNGLSNGDITPRSQKSEVRSQKSDIKDILPLSIDIEKPKGGEEPTLDKKAKALVKIWNKRIDSNLPRVSIVSDKRMKHIKARIREHPEGDFWDNVINKINGSPLLRGEVGNSSWRCTFDWILNANNLAKIVEGNYDDRNKRPGASKEIDSIMDQSNGGEGDLSSGLPQL